MGQGTTKIEEDDDEGEEANHSHSFQKVNLQVELPAACLRPQHYRYTQNYDNTSFMM